MWTSNLLFWLVDVNIRNLIFGFILWNRRGYQIYNFGRQV